MKVHFQDVPGHHVGVRVLRERLVEDGVQALIQFDGDDLLCPLRELDGQDTDAGADFDRHAGTDTRIDQKVLTEGLGKVKAVLLKKSFDF